MSNSDHLQAVASAYKVVANISKPVATIFKSVEIILQMAAAI
jgi:hypothetical protein